MSFGICVAVLLAAPALAEGLPRSTRAPGPPELGQPTHSLTLPGVGRVEESASVLGNRAPAGLPADSYLKPASTAQAAYEVYDRQGKLLGTLLGRQNAGPLQFRPAGS